MDHQENLLGIILSHIWAFLSISMDFGRFFNTRPQPSGVPFLDRLAKIEDLYIPILKKKSKSSEDIMDHQEYLLGIILGHIWACLEH